MLSYCRNRMLQWSFRKRIGIILVLFTLIPLLTVNQLMMYIYEKDIINGAAGTVHSVVAANNSVVDMMLKQVEDASQLMLNNEYYYNVFADFDSYTASDYLSSERRLVIELARQFTTQKEVYEAYLYTPEWIFGKKDWISTTIKGVEHTGLVEKAQNAGGIPCWTAGYDYGKAVDSQYLQQKSGYEYQFPITMVRKMNFQYNYSGDYMRLPDDQCPVLFVYILEQSIRDIYEGSVAYEGSMYGICNEQGIVISSDSDRFPVSSKLPENLSRFAGLSGYSAITVEHEKYLICYDSLKDQNWFSFTLIPMKTIVKNTVMQTRTLEVIAVVVCLLLSAMVAVLLSKTISKPIGLLTKAAIRVATGDFRADTPVPKGKDFRLLTESFNHMETEINRLIHENYEIRLREKETQLMALSMQINPHFLYNTLNTINMLAIQNDDEETSELIVSLSEMLKYTFKNTSEKIPLSDEIGWLRNYINIMSMRYENVFVTDIDMEEGLERCKVPKFFLQPLVENAIIHGFEGMTQGGLLRIGIYRQGEGLQVCVEDNGKGMDAEYIKVCITQEAGSEEVPSAKVQSHSGMAGDGGIGIDNVHRRLVLIYGDRYCVHADSGKGKGTKLYLNIPYEV